jgi:hypothetical protein
MSHDAVLFASKQPPELPKWTIMGFILNILLILEALNED